jgi:uncharacterized protein YrrD
MLVLKEALVGVPVMSLHTGEEIAQTERAIIDPRQLMVVAFFCQGSRLDFHPAVLHTEDIREVSELGFIVNSADDLMPQEDLVRLKEVTGLNFALEGKPVIDESGTKLGKVHNYSTDNKSFQIMQLHVTPQIWQALQTTEHIIGRNQIVEITDTQIVVKSATVGDEAPATGPKPITNPFRRVPTQPEVAPTSTDREPV